MENPATWDAATVVVDDALRQAHEAALKLVCGLSTARRVTDALRAAGFCLERHDEPTRCRACEANRAAGCSEDEVRLHHEWAATRCEMWRHDREEKEFVAAQNEAARELLAGRVGQRGVDFYRHDQQENTDDGS